MRLSEQREHHDEEHEPPNEGVTPPRPRDKKIDQAKAALLDELFPNGDEVYYAQQIEVHFEELTRPIVCTNRSESLHRSLGL